MYYYYIDTDDGQFSLSQSISSIPSAISSNSSIGCRLILIIPKLIDAILFLALTDFLVADFYTFAWNLLKTLENSAMIKASIMTIAIGPM